MTDPTRLLRRPSRPPPAYEPTAVPHQAPLRHQGLELSSLVLACQAARGLLADRLLEGLAGPDRKKARALLTAARATSSQERQRGLSLAFGIRSDADARLTLLAHEAPHALRAELRARLPHAYRAAFPSEAVVAPGVGGVLRSRLATRLLTEAMR